MARAERELVEEEAIEVELEEKKIVEEERKLQAKKDAMLKLKQI